MLNKKKGLAMLLAATMVVGSAFPVLAAEQSTSGGTTGAGTSEGHLEKKITNVTLPTDTTPSVFAYNIDPERLIQETTGSKYANTAFPEAESDTGVYFAADLTDDDSTNNITSRFANTSKVLKVINKSSHNIKLTVKAKASQAATDITLASSNAIEGDTPQLYLGLTVGTETKAISTTETVFSSEIDGMESNFETKYDATNSKYVFAEKSGATGWKETTISMTGACNEASAKDLTVPTVTITWEFTDPTAAPADAAPSVTDTNVNLVSGQPLEIAVNMGAGNKKATDISSITFPASNGTVNTVATSKYTYADGKITFGADWTTAQSSAIGSGNTRTYTITFNDGESTTGTFTATAP